MNGIMVVGCAIIIFFLAYRIYGRWLLHTWGVDENAKTIQEKLQETFINYLIEKVNK